MPAIRDAPAAVPWPRQLSPPTAGAARIPWPELTGAAEQLESGSHTGRDLKLTSPNEVTALESTNHPRWLGRARGTTTLLGERVPLLLQRLSCCPQPGGSHIANPFRHLGAGPHGPPVAFASSSWSKLQHPPSQLIGHICALAGDMMEEKCWPMGRWPRGCVAQPQLRGHQPPLTLSHLTSPNALWGWDEEQSSHPPTNPPLPPSTHPSNPPSQGWSTPGSQ